jgi:hypothetical protein
LFSPPPKSCAANPGVDAGTDTHDAEDTTADADVVSPLDGPDAD